MRNGDDELTALLTRAGLELIGSRRIENVMSPRDAWRPMASSLTTPTATVPCERPDLIAELNAQWFGLASRSGVLAGDGMFLIDVAGAWPGPRLWTRVRLASSWDLAGVLGPKPGNPEFVTLSMSGDALVGATTEEYSVWLITEERINEPQDTADTAVGSAPASDTQDS